MPQPVRYIAFGALALGAVGGLASCAADSTSSSTLAPMVVDTTAFATMPPVTSPPTTLPGETTTIAPGAPIAYIVKSGDYLYGIAKAHGVSAEDIKTLNGWASLQEELTPGESILVPAPVGGAPVTSAPPAGTSPPAGTAPPTGASTSAPPAGGDTTSTIAPAGESTTSAPGVPADGQEYTVKNNDTVYGIAKKFGITPQALVGLNGWPDVNHNIYPGDKIVVPAS